MLSIYTIAGESSKTFSEIFTIRLHRRQYVVWFEWRAMVPAGNEENDMATKDRTMTTGEISTYHVVQVTGVADLRLVARRYDDERVEIWTDNGYCYADAACLSVSRMADLVAAAIVAKPRHRRFLAPVTAPVVTVEIDLSTMRAAYRRHGAAYPSPDTVRRVRQLAEQARNATNTGIPSFYPAVDDMARAGAEMVASDAEATLAMWKRFSEIHWGTPEGNAAVGWGESNAWLHG